MMKAPFPWFGGKSRVADIVWAHFGNVVNYVEPFFGSGAVLLARPHDPVNETVNDKDCYLANFWRALQLAPDEVTEYANWPVNEADLHARHLWLVNQDEFRERMKSDPVYFDAKIAGWWVWGISQWIGSGWCTRPEWRGRHSCERAPRGGHRASVSRHLPSNGVLWKTRPNLNSNGVHRKLPAVGRGGSRGVHRESLAPPHKRPQIKRGGLGVLSSEPLARLAHQLPDISGDGGASGRGIFSQYANNLEAYMFALAHRMRRVRVCCGDWQRILGPSPTTAIGTTAVFLDPPYGVDRSAVYNEENFDVAHDVRGWAIANGENPDLRIALCGYEGEHQMPASWHCVSWKAQGGYGNQSGGTKGRENARKERIWFSPHCVKQRNLFDLEAEASA